MKFCFTLCSRLVLSGSLSFASLKPSLHPNPPPSSPVPAVLDLLTSAGWLSSAERLPPT